MAVNIQTIKDIRNYLLEELNGIYPCTEINAMADIIILKLCNIKKINQLYDPRTPVSPYIADRVKSIRKELITGRPLQYILGETIFYDCRIIVNENVLIPRPETEELVDMIIKENNDYPGKITDFCTGSGCIAIALATKLPKAKIRATDISSQALEVASNNAKLNNVKIDFQLSDLLNYKSRTEDKTGIIVSNPPYVRNSEKKLMADNVLGYEPHIALFVPDEDPLLFYKALLKVSQEILTPGSKIYLEINEAMGNELILLFKTGGFTDVTVIKDINGRDRILKATKNG